MSEVIDLGENVWECPCGNSYMFLLRSGKIKCSECDTDHGQLWIWDAAND